MYDAQAHEPFPISDIPDDPIYFHPDSMDAEMPFQSEGNSYLAMRNDHLTYFDPDGRNPGRLAPLLLVPLTRLLLKYEIKRRLKRITQCEAIYLAYKNTEANCRACRVGTPQAEANTNFACWSAVAAGRSLYLAKKCDYYLPGSIRAGSKMKENAHKAELAKVFKVAATCLMCVRETEKKLPSP